MTSSRDAIRAQVAARVAQEEVARQDKGGAQDSAHGFFAGLDLSHFDTGCFLDEEPPPLDWVLADSLLSSVVGYVAGAQGTGKSRFLLQIGAAVATGYRGFLGDALRPARKGKVLAVFCEEDRRVLWRRVRRMFRAFCPSQAESDDGRVVVFPHPAEADFRANFIAIPAAGQDLRLIEVAGGDAQPSRNFFELLTLAKSIPSLALVILDPQSRLYGANENDNSAATTFCSLLERLAQETGAAVLCCAHTTKGGAKKKDGSMDIQAALHQDAMRGASGFSAAARWQLNLVSLPGKTARAEGVASNAGDGQFLAGKVCKANDAPLGDVFYLRRENDGTLRHIEPERSEEDKALEAQLVERITAEVRRREAEREPALTIKALGDVFPGRWKEDIPGATKAAVRAAAAATILDGELYEVLRKNSGNGKQVAYLATTPDRDQSSGQPTPSGGKSTGQSTGQKPPDSTGQKAPSGDNILQNQQKSTGQRNHRTEALSGAQVLEIVPPDHRTASPSKEGNPTCPVDSLLGSWDAETQEDEVRS
ncbi:AAA family ATPase [Solidesulfovibrio sp. C21]|uniref:AAA family ATPase n=1 Tax=Solidesulfovibrio sp. C21 TaxID=3398613 RepID=UPI0039FBC158